jgi:hypothetical protein
MEMRAFLLWHVRELPEDEEDEKLLGVFSNALKAEHARDKAMGLPGFSDHPDGFRISEYRIDETQWTEGFVAVTNTTAPKKT